MKKTLVITGASKGIGLATARLFLDQGYEIVNVSRSQIPLQTATQIFVDLAAPEDLQAKQEAIIDAVKGSDQLVLVHNAALMNKDSVKNITAEAMRDAFEVSVTAPTILNQILFKHMLAGSAIIYIGSTLSEKAVPNTASYVISKHATAGLMRSTCQDLIRTGIHTACVCPGFTETEMLKKHVGNDQGTLDLLATKMADNRLISPQEIASTIYFCAMNPVLNGSLIHANLGQIEN